MSWLGWFNTVVFVGATMAPAILAMFLGMTRIVIAHKSARRDGA